MKPLASTVRGAVAALALGCAGIAMADEVKDGVDAWSRGDYAAAVAAWQGPAESGDADALFNLAQAYRLGRGVAPDVERARDLYRRAADGGHLKAADNYGLLLFQQGEREQAMPYITAAAERGDPRAQYVVGLAMFNGDLAEKDWIKAYALLTLANSAGLPQAASALQQMDGHVPLEDRQKAQALAARLKAESDARRSTELAAADLRRQSAGPDTQTPRIPRPVSSTSVAASSAAAPSQPAEPAPVAISEPARAAVPAQATSDGPWRVQLGAFGVQGNAERLWGKLSRISALSGKRPFYVPAGRLTKLLAGGFASQSDAAKACSAIKATGQACLVTKK